MFHALLRPRLMLLFALLTWLRPPAARAQSVPAFDQASLCGVPANATSEARVTQLIADAAGNSYLVGDFDGTVAFGATTLTGGGMFVARRDAAGQFVWAVGAAQAYCTALALDGQASVVVTGVFTGPTLALSPSLVLTHSGTGINSGKNNLFVAKLTTAGAWQWAAQAGGNITVRADDVRGMAVDGQGDIVVVGTLESPQLRFGGSTLSLNNLGSAGTDVFVAKLNAAGNWLWAVSGGTMYAERATAVAVDSGGEIYLTGQCANGFATGGPVSLPTGAGLLVAKLNALGQWQWLSLATSTVGSGNYPSGSAYAGSIAVDAQARWLYIGGSFNGRTASFGPTTLSNNSGLTQLPGLITVQQSDVFTARLNAGTGTWGWAVRAGGVGSDGIGQLAFNPVGSGLYVAGGFGVPPIGATAPPAGVFGATVLANYGGGDAFMAELDTAGTWRWALRGGGSNYDSFGSVSLDGAGRLHVLGSSEGGVTAFGPLTLQVPPSPRAGGFIYYGTSFQVRVAGGPLAAAPGRAAAGFALYPNPGRGQAWVTGLPAGQAVEVRDVLGRLVLRARVPAAGPCPLALPTAHAPGVYLVRAGAGALRWVVE